MVYKSGRCSQYLHFRNTFYSKRTPWNPGKPSKRAIGKYLPEKIRDGLGIYDHGEDDPINTPVQMCFVVDSVAEVFALKIRIDHVQYTEDKTGYANDAKKINFLQRKINDARKHHGRNSSGSPKAVILGKGPFFPCPRKIGQYQGGYIEQNKHDRTIRSKDLPEHHLHQPSKKIKGKHIEPQMDVTSVDEPGSDQPPIFISIENHKGVHQQFLKYTGILKSPQADNHSNDDNDCGN